MRREELATRPTTRASIIGSEPRTAADHGQRLKRQPHEVHDDGERELDYTAGAEQALEQADVAANMRKQTDMIALFRDFRSSSDPASPVNARRGRGRRVADLEGSDHDE